MIYIRIITEQERDLVTPYQGPVCDIARDKKFCRFVSYLSSVCTSEYFFSSGNRKIKGQTARVIGKEGKER